LLCIVCPKFNKQRYLYGDTAFFLSDSSITDNTFISGTNVGAAVFVDAGVDATITNCRFTNNIGFGPAWWR